MFNEDVIFMFYSKSKDVDPGKGTGEKLPNDLIPEYAELKKIKDWRKMLSNFYIAPFKLDGKEWNSVEHYYQGSKFKKENPEFYHQFSLDSGSELSKDPNMAKSAGGKTGKVNGKIFRPKTVSADADFFSKESNRINEEMYLAQYAKFTNASNNKDKEELRNVLLATKDAKLMHVMSRSSVRVFFENLIIIRDLMKNGKV